jgi:microcystin-dependent protein
MSYNTGINQLVKTQEFFSNTTAEDQPITQTNLSLIANLAYVKNWASSVISGYLPINNPIFTGTLTSSSGGSINLSMPSSTLSVPTIPTNTNFTGQPTIQISGNQYSIAVRNIGEVKMFVTSTAPSNYLLCNGQQHLSADYPQLYAIIGTNYGGNGTYFNVPDMVSRFPIGASSPNQPPEPPSSNFATGNGASGGNNNAIYFCDFGGVNIPQPVPPVVSTLPPHSHNIIDEGHQHFTGLGSNQTTLLGIPVNDFVQPGSTQGYATEYAKTGVVIQTNGTNITQGNDPVSGLSGVNLSPPYLAVNYFICYQ